MTTTETGPRRRKSDISFLTFFAIITFLLIIFISLTLTYTGILDPFENKANTYKEVRNALSIGNKLRAVVHYDKMNLYVDGVKVKSPNVTTGLGIENYEHFERESVGNDLAYIATSNTQLISHPKFGVLYNYGKIRIFEDETIEIEMKYLDPVTYKVITQELFNSTLSSGAIYFFNQSPEKYALEDNLGNRKHLF